MIAMVTGDYRAWRSEVDRLLRKERPDVDPSRLDPNACYAAYQASTPPLDYVRSTDLAFGSKTEESAELYIRQGKDSGLGCIWILAAGCAVGTSLLTVGAIIAEPPLDTKNVFLALPAMILPAVYLAALIALLGAWFKKDGDKRVVRIGALSFGTMTAINAIALLVLAIKS